MAIIGSFCGTLLAVGVVFFLGWLGDRFDHLEEQQREDRRDYYRKRR